LIRAPLDRQDPVRLPPGLELTLWQEQDKSAYLATAKVVDNRAGDMLR